MLAREQRGRHDHSDLLAFHGDTKGRTHGDFRLTEADIAADQTVHRLAAFEIVQRRVRSADDLRAALGVPVLTIITDQSAKKTRRPRLAAPKRRIPTEVGSA